MGRREQIRGRLEAATPGAWEAVEHSGHLGESGAWSVYPVADMWADEREAENADLIANAPSDLRDLLAVADQAQHYCHIVAAAYGPGDAAYEEAVDLLFSALARLDNGGDR